MKKSIKGLLTSLVIAATLGAGAAVANPTTANAASISSKYAYGRWAGQTITYHINSTSTYYHSMWTNAVKAWNKNGVLKLKQVAKSDNPQLTLTTRASLGSTKINKRYDYETHNVNNNTSETIDGLKQLDFSLISMNRAYFKFYHLNHTYRTSLAEHELGVTLGLKDLGLYADHTVMTLEYPHPINATKSDLAHLAQLYR